MSPTRRTYCKSEHLERPDFTAPAFQRFRWLPPFSIFLVILTAMTMLSISPNAFRGTTQRKVEFGCSVSLIDTDSENGHLCVRTTWLPTLDSLDWMNPATDQFFRWPPGDHDRFSFYWLSAWILVNRRADQSLVRFKTIETKWCSYLWGSPQMLVAGRGKTHGR